MDLRAALLILPILCLALGLMAYSPLSTANRDCVPIRLCRRFAPGRFAGTGSIGETLLDELAGFGFHYLSCCCDFFRHEIQGTFENLSFAVGRLFLLRPALQIAQNLGHGDQLPASHALLI